MLLGAIDTLPSFREVTISTTDPKAKIKLSKCSACSALVAPMETHQHKRFHDELRTIARQAGLTR
jgi:hypothetical protein